MKHDWEDAICLVCMEVPHIAVLLLCSSYKMGCRLLCVLLAIAFPTVFNNTKGPTQKSSSVLSLQRAYIKSSSVLSLQLATNDSDSNTTADVPRESAEVLELLCPFCRMQLKGWMVVEPARKYLNGKKRTCMQDGCSFVGTYK